jgi:hypothetical protein
MGLDISALRETFALGAVFGRYVEVQYCYLLPLAVHFVRPTLSPLDYERDKLQALEWFEEILTVLKRLKLTDMEAFEDVGAYRDNLAFERLSTDQVMNLRDRIDEWSAVVTLFLAERGGAPPGAYPVWFGIGFFGAHLHAKMRLYSDYQDSIGFDLSLSEPLDILIQMVAMENEETGLVDPEWIERLASVASAQDQPIIEAFRSEMRDILRSSVSRPS